MKFQDLQLMMAVKMYHDSGGHLREVSNHRDQIDRVMEVASIYARWFETTVFPWEYDEATELILGYRKLGEKRIKVDVALVHGHRCFWIGRNKGPCDDDVECGHLIPRSKGGPLSVENCMIECHAHNNQRREMLIEEYLGSDLSTET